MENIRYDDSSSLSLDLSVGPSPLKKQIDYEVKFYEMDRKNKKLQEMLETLQNKIANITAASSNISRSENGEISPTKKRHAQSEITDEEISNKRFREEVKPRVTRIYVKTDPSDTSLIVKDEYQWRKYGQKVTRDNPSPRAYFKCSFAPSCPVKKKVQRSAEDKSLIIATYEGEHNHKINNSSIPTFTFDLRKQGLYTENVYNHINSQGFQDTLINQMANSLTKDHIKSQEFQNILINHMANSLTKDPSFTEALVNVISGKIFENPIVYTE